MRHKFKIDEEEGVQGAYANSDANLLLNVNLNPLSLQPGFPATFKEAFSNRPFQNLGIANGWGGWWW